MCKPESPGPHSCSTGVLLSSLKSSKFVGESTVIRSRSSRILVSSLFIFYLEPPPYSPQSCNAVGTCGPGDVVVVVSSSSIVNTSSSRLSHCTTSRGTSSSSIVDVVDRQTSCIAQLRGGTGGSRPPCGGLTPYDERRAVKSSSKGPMCQTKRTNQTSTAWPDAWTQSGREGLTIGLRSANGY